MSETTEEQAHRQFEMALSSPTPSHALHELAKKLKTEGMQQVEMYHLFARFQQRVDSEDPRYDAIVDNMDLIWGGGWAKGQALFDAELTNADIDQRRGS